MWVEADYQYMSRALQLARRGIYTTDPNPRVGCILVRNNFVLAEGWHQFAGGPHAEINALNHAGGKASGADCYVTLEPCSHTGKTPPCADALIAAEIRRVIVATDDPNPLIAGQGVQRLKAAGIKTEIGLMQAQARELNPGFEMRMRYGRPFVRSKLAISLDGKTALANGRSKWITGAEARKDVQRLRAQSSSILTGIGTVQADDPALTVRDIDTANRQPLRVVLDPDLKMPATAKMLKEPGRTLLFTLTDSKEKKNKLTSAGAEIIKLDAEDRQAMVQPVLVHLAKHEMVNEVLVEAGSVLNGTLLCAGLIDELIIYVAPHILGHDARGLFNIPEVEEMNKRFDLEFTDMRMVGRDIRITLKPVTNK